VNIDVTIVAILHEASCPNYSLMHTGVDLSKLLVGQTQILGSRMW